MNALLSNYPFRSVLSLRPLLDHLEAVRSRAGGEGTCVPLDLPQNLLAAPELREPLADPTVLDRNRGLVNQLMGTVFPAASWDTEAFGALHPFAVEPFFLSPPLRQLLAGADGADGLHALLGEEGFARAWVMRAYVSVLEKVYGIHQDLDLPLVFPVEDPETGLKRLYKLVLDFRFVDARAVHGPTPLTAAQRLTLRDHLAEPEVLRTVLEPADYELSGFVIARAVDVTASEAISSLERELIDRASLVTQAGFARIQEGLRTLFQKPDLGVGLAALRQGEVLLVNVGCDLCAVSVFADSRRLPMAEFANSVWARATASGELMRVADLREETPPDSPEAGLVAAGVRSFLVAPLVLGGECIGTLDLGSPTPGALGPMDALLLREVQPLFAVALQRTLDDMDGQVQAIIKQECTAIHPSVEWRFREAALRHLENQQDGRPSEFEPIVFRDVYPFYGLADIRGSAGARSRAIQADLSDHLRLAREVVLAAAAVKPMASLDEFVRRFDAYQAQIQQGLAMHDELAVVKFLRREVEPFFPHLRGFGAAVAEAVQGYERAVDAGEGTVYQLRKEFEESVTLLNERLTGVLDREEAAAQAVFPHYFERHRTDGVDYQIYMGSSMVEGDSFSELYLQNLRLWQLKVACALAWHTEQMKSELKVPLDTAHLIFAQHTPLSIRFRFDEKQFDVDGAYDTRHAIIKSRLDKALVKGTRERLTQPRKVAVVLATAEEHEEMGRHIAYLREEGYFRGPAEELEIEDLPGVQGLKALRVDIDLDSERLRSPS